MKTQPKITFLLCLIFITYFNNSCGLIIKEKRIVLEYKFVNNTKKRISINPTRDIILVEPNSTRVIYRSNSNEKEINEGYFIKEPPMTFICRPCVLYYDAINCDTLNGDGPENRANFDFLKKIDSNSWQLQYTFTDADYQRSKPCN